MKFFVDFWKFTKIWKGLHYRNKELFLFLTFRCAEQFYVPNMQKQSKPGKNPVFNRWSFVIWWHNSWKYRFVWYLLSCTQKYIFLYSENWPTQFGLDFRNRICSKFKVTKNVNDGSFFYLSKISNFRNNRFFYGEGFVKSNCTYFKYLGV